MSKEINKRDYVNSLVRGLAIMRAFTRSRPSMTLSEISRATNLPRAAVRRFMLTLVGEGYAETDGKHFNLKPKVLELGYAALSSLSFVEVAQPIMARLAFNLEESVFAAMLDDEDVVYVASAVSPERRVRISVAVGSRAPAHAVSTGRILLAALPEEAREAYLAKVKLSRFTPNTVTSRAQLRKLIDAAAEQGFSIVDQELEVGLRSISVPIRHRDGAVAAALNVACPSSRVTREDMNARVLPELQAASQSITAALH